MELEEGDFGAAVEADGREDDAEAAVDVHVGVTGMKKAFGIFVAEVGGDYRGAKERESDLSAMGVAGKDEVGTGAFPLFEVVGVVHEDEGEGGVDAGKGAVDVDAFGPEVAKANDRQDCAADGYEGGGVAEDGDAALLEVAGDDVGVEPVVVVAEAGEDAVRGFGFGHDAGATGGEFVRFPKISVNVLPRRVCPWVR